MTSSKRLVAALCAITLLSTLLGACSSGTSAHMTAKYMVQSEVNLDQPAGPDIVDTTQQESPSPRTQQTSAVLGSAPAHNDRRDIADEEKMSVAPYEQPKRFHEFSEQGATNLVAYFIYAAYYSFVSRDTGLMANTFSAECDKCLQMQSWIEKFLRKNAQVETGIPRTVIKDVYIEKNDGETIIWVVAHNDEPSVVGHDEKGKNTGFDPASESLALYKVQYIEGKNQITGIFNPPDKYR